MWDRPLAQQRYQRMKAIVGNAWYRGGPPRSTIFGGGGWIHLGAPSQVLGVVLPDGMRRVVPELLKNSLGRMSLPSCRGHGIPIANSVEAEAADGLAVDTANVAGTVRTLVLGLCDMGEGEVEGWQAAFARPVAESAFGSRVCFMDRPYEIEHADRSRPGEGLVFAGLQAASSSWCFRHICRSCKYVVHTESPRAFNAAGFCLLCHRERMTELAGNAVGGRDPIFCEVVALKHFMDILSPCSVCGAPRALLAQWSQPDAKVCLGCRRTEVTVSACRVRNGLVEKITEDVVIEAATSNDGAAGLELGAMLPVTR